MTALQTEANTERGFAGARPSAAKPALASRILAAVDGTESTNGVVEYLLTRAAGAAEIVVLNVQDKSDDWRLRGYGSFMRREVDDRLINDRGQPIVRSVGLRFSKAGLAHRERVEIGDPAETIMRCAAEEGCGLIVVGDPRPGPVRRWITQVTGLSFASVASDLVQLASVPVVIAR